MTTNPITAMALQDGYHWLAFQDDWPPIILD
jgi:hypothetical protein